jgi:PTH1 family peptidyl-tRNA hydrolase
MKLIFGLGNPGKQYQKTRHNFGFLALDTLRNFLLTEQIGPWELSKKFNAEICGCTWRGEKIILARPMTFMNESGIAVQLLAHYYKIAPREIIVVHDEKDLLFGTFKYTTGSRSAGHNGVGDIIEKLGTQDFARIRIGVETRVSGDPTPTDAFVLQNFSEEELHTLNMKIFPETDKLIEQFINS